MATFAAGLLAVGAALLVSQKQNKILIRQSKLAENDLKTQLLDKRLECLAILRPIVGHWSREARLGHDQIDSLIQLLHRTEILYPRELNSKIDAAIRFAIGAQLFGRRSTEYFDRGNETKGQEFLEKSFAEEDKLFENMQNLLGEIVDHTRLDFWESTASNA
jgi:hypothetical protein